VEKEWSKSDDDSYRPKYRQPHTPRSYEQRAIIGGCRRVYGCLEQLVHGNMMTSHIMNSVVQVIFS
jgi:hypothetical protein